MGIKNFRLIKNTTFEPARLINLIVGKNGTAKSTILGMIAQGFSFNNNNIYNISAGKYNSLIDKRTKGEMLSKSDDDIITSYASTFSYLGKNYESDANEHFKLSNLDARGKKHTKIKLSSQHRKYEDAPYMFTIESTNHERENPRFVVRRNTHKLVKGKNTASSNIPFPVIYLGLERVQPIVRTTNILSCYTKIVTAKQK